VLSVLVLGAIADDDYGKDVVNLVKDKFDTEVSKKPHFIMFFAPWCRHCKNLAPSWQELAEKYNKADEQKVVVAKVDCTIETDLCSSQNVTEYPTLKFFKSGADSSVMYRGSGIHGLYWATIFDSLVGFIDVQMGIAPATVEGVAEHGLYHLGEKTFAKHIKEGSHLVKFYAPWCGHCKEMAYAWDALAKEVDGDESISMTIAKVDCTEHPSVCQEQGVAGVPTIMFFRAGEMVENYEGYRTLMDFKEYVVSMNDDKNSGSDDGKAEIQKVTLLNATNFEESVKSGVSFVKFFDPWCGRCKRLARTWEKLAAKYVENDNVKIFTVVCTAEPADGNVNEELCDGQDFDGFPTLNLYKDGKKITEYTGKETVEALVEFIAWNTKDEL